MSICGWMSSWVVVSVLASVCRRVHEKLLLQHSRFLCQSALRLLHKLLQLPANPTWWSRACDDWRAACMKLDCMLQRSLFIISALVHAESFLAWSGRGSRCSWACSVSRQKGLFKRCHSALTGATPQTKRAPSVDTLSVLVLVDVELIPLSSQGGWCACVMNAVN